MENLEYVKTKNDVPKVENKNSLISGLKQFTYHKYFHEITLVIVLIIISVVLSFLTPHFLTSSNLLIVLQQVSITTIIAFGMAFVIISQGIDLSVGAAISLVGLPVAVIIIAGEGSPMFIALGILSGITLGALIGFINGLNIVYLRMAPFIATLAMMSICRGAVLSITKGRPVFGLPNSFIFIGNGFVGPVPFSVIVMITIFLLVVWITEYTPFGRIIYALGGNEEATRLAGINVKKIRILVYMISGICVGIAGTIFTARLASAQPAAGDPFLFNSITAAILGGVALFGGSGTMVGVLIGAILIGVIDNGQALLNVDPYLQHVIRGIIVLIAVATGLLRKG
ncbi:MAG: ABC transporter permease [Desulfobacterales bacterium]|jgi:ribose transport system permease protein